MPGRNPKREQETGVEALDKALVESGSCDVGHVSVGGGGKEAGTMPKTELARTVGGQGASTGHNSMEAGITSKTTRICRKPPGHGLHVQSRTASNGEGGSSHNHRRP